MTRTEREELLRRFLDGELDSSQEHDFYINVALDNELRTELKAHQTIDSAIRKDGTIDPMEYAPIEMAVARMLTSMPRNAASPSAPAAMPVTPRPVAATAESEPRSSMRRLMGGTALLLGMMATLLVILWPSEPAAVGTYRTDQQTSPPIDNHATHADSLNSVGAVRQGIVAEPNAGDNNQLIMPEQRKTSAAERSTRTTKGTARPKPGDPGVSAATQLVQKDSGHQQQEEQASRSQAAPQQYISSDSAHGGVQLQWKNKLPK